MEEIYDFYFGWLSSLVVNEDDFNKYNSLLQKLNNETFHYSLDMDGNRYQDGIDIRYRFGYEVDINSVYIEEYLDIREPSLLEVIAALVVKAYEQILYNSENGYNSVNLFYDIIKSLGLNENSTQEDVYGCAVNLYNHSYGLKGEGGMFTIPNATEPVNEQEIWVQMMWYLDYVLGM